MKPETDYEEWDSGEEEDLEEELKEEWAPEVEEPEDEWGPEAVKPKVRILVFLGLVVFAAIFSVILWNVTHGGKGESDVNNQAVSQDGESREPGMGTASGEEAGAGIDPASGGSAGSDAGTAPDEDPERGMGTASDEDPERDAGMASDEDPEPGVETASGEAADSGINAASGEGTDPEDIAAGNGENGTMAFTECEDRVTPKDVINLRSAPSTVQGDNVVTRAVNGEVLNRTGINSDTGWSRLDYNGQTLYAVSRYLTTDLSYQPPVPTADPNSVSTKDGRTITFTDCDDRISPKMYVNLRLEPSTSEGNDTVHCQLAYGQVVHRTGISEASGWSRVEYDGYVLYVVTSYMYVVEEAEGQAETQE
ncbi:MAG: hypothetical protein NC123_12490 [Butyrivibrio sp.]|nr:hypothetical protein [Acetatifactor muris]MCM1560341.1 hypothetical protein [Butyrivibrio sp.]